MEEQREAAEAEAHRVQDKYSRIKHKYMRQTHIQAEVNKVLARQTPPSPAPPAEPTTMAPLYRVA